MKRLIDLLHSLTAVIVRYHDAHAPEKLIEEPDLVLLQKKTRALSPTILSKVDYEDYLKELVKRCTVGYETRKPLLHYLVHEITFLKTMLDRKQSFNDLELIQYKQQVTQMLLDFKQLLLTKKGSFYKVSHSKLGTDAVPAISISGVINDGYWGNKYCFSGDLINALLGEFHLSCESSKEEMSAFAENICQEHQNILLVPELAQAKKTQGELLLSEQGKVTALTSQVDTLTSEAAKNKLELEQALAKIKALDKLLEDEAAKVTALSTKIEKLTSKVTEARHASMKTTVSVEAQTEPGPTPQEKPFGFNPALLGFGVYGPTMFALKRYTQQQKKVGASEAPATTNGL